MGFGFYYPVQSTFDMCSGQLGNSMNLAMNQALFDMSARSSLFSAPGFTFGGFTPYASYTSGMNFLTDPMYALYQTNWQYMNQFGTSMFGPNGVYSWMNPFYTKPSDSSNSKKEKTEEELETERINKEYKPKLDKISNLLNQVAAYYYNIETNEDKQDNVDYKDLIDKFKEITDDKTLNNQEKYDKLKVYYDEFKENGVIEEFLVDTKTLSKSSTKSVATNDAKSVRRNLIAMGYEMNTDADSEYAKVISAIKEVSNSNGNPTGSNVVSALENGYASSYDILDVISSVNSISVKNGDNTTLIQLLVNKRNSIKDEMRGNLNNIIKSLKESLVKEANDVLRNSGLDSASQETFQNAIDALSSYDKYDSSLVTKFNTVYTYTRVVAAKKLSRDLEATYGSIDPDLFTENLYLNKTAKNTESDLLSEKMSASDISAAKALVFKQRSVNSITRRRSDDDDSNVVVNPANNTTSSSNTNTTSDVDDKSASVQGKDIHHRLKGYTYDEDYFEIDKSLSNLNSNNIIGFMDGFYSVSGHEGLLEFCDDEWDGGAIKMENKKNAIAAMLERAERHPELTNTYAYIKLKEIYDNYTGGEMANATTFNNNHKFTPSSWWKGALGAVTGVVGGIAAGVGALLCGGSAAAAVTGLVASGPIGWAIGGCALLGAGIWALADRETDNERADQYMKTLYNEIKRLEAK